MERGYLRFGLMILTATVVMFLLTYTNLYSIDHARWSEERAYMSLMMGSVMTVVMLGFMWPLHPNRRVNSAIVASALAMAAFSFWLSQSQYFVDDEDYMAAMIPHHSIAILTSNRADIEDVRVRDLADRIIASQEQEIAEMNWLLDDIEDNGLARSEQTAQERPVPERFRSTDTRQQ